LKPSWGSYSNYSLPQAPSPKLAEEVTPELFWTDGTSGHRCSGLGSIDRKILIVGVFIPWIQAAEYILAGGRVVLDNAYSLSEALETPKADDRLCCYIGILENQY
jgi:hypothetical protein